MIKTSKEFKKIMFICLSDIKDSKDYLKNTNLNDYTQDDIKHILKEASEWFHYVVNVNDKLNGSHLTPANPKLTLEGLLFIESFSEN